MRQMTLLALYIPVDGNCALLLKGGATVLKVGGQILASGGQNIA